MRGDYRMSVKYTRQHFRDIAALVAKLPKKDKKGEAERFCKLFAASNPQFDRKKFLAACGVD
jgi:hypothetical protein